MAKRSSLLLVLPLFMLLGMSPLHAEESRWALLVGIDDYVDPGISKLTGSVRDATAIREALVTNARFPSDQVFLLTSDNPSDLPTNGNIIQKLEYVASHADQDDLFFLHFSLHAVVDSKTGEGYLLTRMTEMNRFKETGLSLAELRKVLEGMVAPKRIVVLDGCRNDPEKGPGRAPIRWPSPSREGS